MAEKQINAKKQRTQHEGAGKKGSERETKVKYKKKEQEKDRS